MNVPSDVESNSQTELRIEVMGYLVLSIVKTEQTHSDLSLHTEKHMSKQIAISTASIMISFFISYPSLDSGLNDTYRDSLPLCIAYGVLRSAIATVIRSNHKGTVVNHPAIPDLITPLGVKR